uniref:Uncharacterized protein n=1 Tax=Magallana gigas TaxID=29159 RepID=A0A8W8NSJ8_MAGGI
MSNTSIADKIKLSFENKEKEMDEELKLNFAGVSDEDGFDFAGLPNVSTPKGHGTNKQMKKYTNKNVNQSHPSDLTEVDEFAEQNFSHPASIDPMEANKRAEQNFSLPTHMDLTELKDTAKEENEENEETKTTREKNPPLRRSGREKRRPDWYGNWTDK